MTDDPEEGTRVKYGDRLGTVTRLGFVTFTVEFDDGGIGKYSLGIDLQDFETVDDTPGKGT